MRTSNFPEKRNQRRLKALVRLEEQLKSGLKTTKDGDVSLSKEDKTRIEKEISILSKRVVANARDRHSKIRRG